MRLRPSPARPALARDSRSSDHVQALHATSRPAAGSRGSSVERGNGLGNSTRAASAQNIAALQHHGGSPSAGGGVGGGGVVVGAPPSPALQHSSQPNMASLGSPHVTTALVSSRPGDSPGSAQSVPDAATPPAAAATPPAAVVPPPSYASLSSSGDVRISTL